MIVSENGTNMPFSDISGCSGHIDKSLLSYKIETVKAGVVKTW